jgi:hypothetical protein
LGAFCCKRLSGVDSFVHKQSYGAKWLWSPNNLSQSVAGIKMSQPLAYGWSLIGAFEWGFNPYYGFPAAAQQSQVNQNGKALLLQGAGADSSRTGQPDNSQGFIGVSNTTYGDTEAARANTALKYRVDLPTNLFGLSGSNFRLGALWQWGGYDQLNGTNGMYQGQVGGDFNLFGGSPFAGTLSLDATGSYAKDA